LRDPKEQRYEKSRGWFYQAIAPLTTLAAVRSAGQVAHNDIELELLKQKWSRRDVSIQDVTFEFADPNAPLSWHLTPSEVKEIRDTCNKKMDTCRAKVRSFLER